MEERFWDALWEVLTFYEVEEQEDDWESRVESGECVEGDDHIVHDIRVLEAALVDHYKQRQSADPKS
jgi:hypothetical protein